MAQIHGALADDMEGASRNNGYDFGPDCRASPRTAASAALAFSESLLACAFRSADGLSVVRRPAVESHNQPSGCHL